MSGKSSAAQRILAQEGPLSSSDLAERLVASKLSSTAANARKDIQRATHSKQILSTAPVRFDKSYLYYLPAHRGRAYATAVRSMLPAKPGLHRVYKTILANKGWITYGQIGKASACLPDGDTSKSGGRATLLDLVGELLKLELIETVGTSLEVFRIGTQFGAPEIGRAAFEHKLKIELALLRDARDWLRNSFLLAYEKHSCRTTEASIESFNQSHWDLHGPLYAGPFTRDSTLRRTQAKEAFLVLDFLGYRPFGKVDAEALMERYKGVAYRWRTIALVPVVIAPSFSKEAWNSLRQAGAITTEQRLWLKSTKSIRRSWLSAQLENAHPTEVVRRFMEHSEQRFRLAYILGSLIPRRVADAEELLDDEEEPSFEEGAEVTEEERETFASKLTHFLGRIDVLATSSKTAFLRAAKDFEIDLTRATPQDRDTLQDLVEEELQHKDEFHQLVDEILDEVESRFEYITSGEVVRSRDGWPSLWTYQSEERGEFIRAVNRFSSNYAPNFGRLLTPLVEGIRVRGPFMPTWFEGDTPRIVLMDGQGIGHTADSTSSVSTAITKRFQLADVIVLVDNAAQPMQAAPVSVLRTLVTSGHESKLIVAFTHFDEVKGDNLIDSRAQKEHVIGSFFNAVQAIGKSAGRESEHALKRLHPDRLVFLANIHSQLPDRARFTRNEFSRLLESIQASVEPAPPIQYLPVYDVANLVLAVQKATQEFHDRWKALFGMGSRANALPEHWTRVKALSRRVGIFKLDEYDTLRPIADLNGRVLAKRWWILQRAPDTAPFWISDNPVASLSYLDSGVTAIEQPGVEAYLPISSRFSLRFVSDVAAITLLSWAVPEAREQSEALLSGKADQLQPDNVTHQNSLQVKQASRFIISISDDFALAREMIGKKPGLKDSPGYTVF